MLCIMTFKGFFCCASCLNNRCCIASCHSPAGHTTLLYASPLFPSVAWHCCHGNRERKYSKNNQAGAEVAGLSYTMCTCCNVVSWPLTAWFTLSVDVTRHVPVLERAIRYVPLHLNDPWTRPAINVTLLTDMLFSVL